MSHAIAKTSKCERGRFQVFPSTSVTASGHAAIAWTSGKIGVKPPSRKNFCTYGSLSQLYTVFGVREMPNFRSKIAASPCCATYWMFVPDNKVPWVNSGPTSSLNPRRFFLSCIFRLGVSCSQNWSVIADRWSISCMWPQSATCMSSRPRANLWKTLLIRKQKTQELHR